MRLLAAVLLVSGSAVLAQDSTNAGFGRIVFPGGNGPGPGNPASAGIGRIVAPGTGAPAVMRPGTSPGPVFPIQLPHGVHSNRSVVGIPVFYGGGYYNYDPLPAETLVPTIAQQPYVGQQPYYQAQPSRQEQPPVVIINQYFRSDGLPADTPAATAAPAPQTGAAVALAPQQDDLRNVFLIAMKDHTIYAASAYWIEDNTLNYITIQGDQNSASLDLVDRDLSQRLNRDRKVSFGLPGN